MDVLVALLLLGFCGCANTIPQPDLGELYNEAASYHGPERNPVIVIPGILGSRLEDQRTGTVVWGAFSGNFADPRTAKGARLVSHPMGQGKPLRELTDSVTSPGALDRVRLSIFGVPLSVVAYANILGTLGVGGYRDMQLGTSGAVDYGTDHYSCFQFPYDWRRDIVENARRLHDFVEEKRQEVLENATARGQAPGDGVIKFDIVAHSMGGLLTRYFLRYGNADLPEDGSVPEVTWAGTDGVERVILVGTPNAGSVLSFKNLLEGLNYPIFIPDFPPAIVGTMPAVYQLLPRYRHGAVFDKKRQEGIDPFEISYWEEREWGILRPDQDEVLQMLLPEASSREERRAIARDHLGKCLRRAERLHAALDRKAVLPDGLDLYLIAGDAEPTSAVMEVDDEGGVRLIHSAPGDGTVLRSSALLDERVGKPWKPRVETPIAWSQVTFLFMDHLGLTRDPGFSDQVLYWLLEEPR